MKEASDLYSEEYFSWQSKVGKFGAWANKFKFVNSINPTDLVIDYGCGGGFLLDEMHKGPKIGIEPNEVAAKEIKFENYRTIQQTRVGIGKRKADVIISNHALEHSLNPLSDLIGLRELLREGGLIHLVVPCETINMKFNSNDVNHHIFTFAPINLGNILKEAGFVDIKVQVLKHKWPPKYNSLAKLGWPVFNLICKAWGRIDRKWYQVVAVGVNNGTPKAH
jgi:hypothetical protein